MKIYLLDVNEAMIDAWKRYFYPTFDDVAPVEFVQSDFTSFMKTHEGHIDAVVSPANAYGLMDGGYDAALTEYFGNNLQLAVQKEIIKRFYGEQPVGTSFSIPIPDHSDMLLIHTPTMRIPSRIKDPLIVYQCMRTTLMEAIYHNCNSIIIPAFGALTGQVKLDVVAKMMYHGYSQIYSEEDRKEITRIKAITQWISLNAAAGKIV